MGSPSFNIINAGIRFSSAGTVTGFNVCSSIITRFQACFSTMVAGAMSRQINPLRPNSDLSQTSHCNIKSFSVSEVMRIENMITRVQFY